MLSSNIPTRKLYNLCFNLLMHKPIIKAKHPLLLSIHEVLPLSLISERLHLFSAGDWMPQSAFESQ
jgi:hypothetical protein